MANSWKHGCNHPGCKELVERGVSLCARHRKKKQKEATELNRLRNPREQEFYNSTEWVTLSRTLRANEPYCRMCAKQGVRSFGYVTDHIVPLKLSWERRLDPSNLQTLCRECDARKRASERTMYQTNRTLPPCTLVCGSIASGKSSYVKANMKRGDIIVDLDAIYAAFTGLPNHDRLEGGTPFSLALRVQDFALDVLGKDYKVDRPALWVIRCAPTRAQRDPVLNLFPNAKLVIVETPWEKCIERVRRDPVRVGAWQKFLQPIKGWWTEYERDDKAIIVDGGGL